MANFTPETQSNMRMHTVEKNRVTGLAAARCANLHTIRALMAQFSATEEESLACAVQGRGTDVTL